MSQSSLLRPLLVTCGLSLTLVGCGSTSTANSRPTRFLSIQPIQVCDDFGLFCADVALFEAETRKIWGNVDIDITFLAPTQLLSSRYLTIDSRDEFTEISFTGGAGAFGRNPNSTRTTGPINMWFVDQILLGAGEVFGLAWVDQNGVLISDNILDFNNGVGRRDTVAHELGHNLGLSHGSYGAGSSSNLMTSGTSRAVPNSVDDITPDGAELSRLNNEQADVARSSGFVTDNAGVSGSPTPITPPSPSLLEQLLRFLQGEDHDHYDAVPKALIPEETIAAEPRPLTQPLSSPLPQAWAVADSAANAVGPSPLLDSATAGPETVQSVPEPTGLLWIPGSLLLWGAWQLRRRAQ